MALYEKIFGCTRTIFPHVGMDDLWINHFKAGLIGCALFLSLSLLADQWCNVFIQKILNSNAQNASYYVDMIFFGWFIGSPFFGFLSEKIASRKRILLGGCVLSLITIMPIILFPQQLSLMGLAFILFLFGFFNDRIGDVLFDERDLFKNQVLIIKIFPDLPFTKGGTLRSTLISSLATQI